MPTTTTTALPDHHWINQNGRVVCRRHGGYGLASAMQADPTALEHTTDLDNWIAINPAAYACEDCR